MKNDSKFAKLRKFCGSFESFWSVLKKRLPISHINAQENDDVIGSDGRQVLIQLHGCETNVEPHHCFVEIHSTKLWLKVLPFDQNHAHVSEYCLQVKEEILKFVVAFV